MNIVDVRIDGWNLLISINLAAVFIIVATFVILHFVKPKHLKLKKVCIDIKGQKFEFCMDYQIQTIAYKIWVELSTRKIGLLFNEEQDVISEVYDSWYSAFGIIRNMMEEIPIDELKRSEKLINATQEVLNNGLRPHLTKWQAKYRKWYNEALEKADAEGRSPQEIQKCFPEYDRLVDDLKETNAEMVDYCNQLKDIVFGSNVREKKSNHQASKEYMK